MGLTAQSTRRRRRYGLARLMYAAPVQTFEQSGELGGRQVNDAVLNLGPAELTILQSLGEEKQPVPSQNTSLMRSVRLARKTNTAPENGLAPMVSPTRAAKPSAPLRKSTGFVATKTLTDPLGPIIAGF